MNSMSLESLVVVGLLFGTGVSFVLSLHTNLLPFKLQFSIRCLLALQYLYKQVTGHVLMHLVHLIHLLQMSETIWLLRQRHIRQPQGPGDCNLANFHHNHLLLNNKHRYHLLYLLTILDEPQDPGSHDQCTMQPVALTSNHLRYQEL